MPRLNGPLDVHFINRTFFPSDNPSKINTGRCFLWAYIAFRLYKGVELWTHEAHAFVKYRGKFYDSQRPHGEEDWRDLPATNFGQGCGCSRCGRPAKQMSPKLFKTYNQWGRLAKRYNVVWKDVRALVQKVVESKT
jgi:hypothetical protein